MKTHNAKHLVMIILRICVLIVTHVLHFVLIFFITSWKSFLKRSPAGLPFTQFRGSWTLASSSLMLFWSLWFVRWYTAKFSSINFVWNIKEVSFVFICSVEINFQAQDAAAPAWGVVSANRNFENFWVPANAVLDQKCRLPSQPVHDTTSAQGSYMYCHDPSHWEEGCLVLTSHVFSVFVYFISYLLFIFFLACSLLFSL